jgi:hypothetical protein
LPSAQIGGARWTASQGVFLYAPTSLPPGHSGGSARLVQALDPGANGTNDPATSELMRRDTRRSADAVARVLGKQQRGETLRGRGAQLHVDGAVSGHRLRRRGTPSGGAGAGVDYLEHDV